MAIDAESKLVISWHISPRDLGGTYAFMMDLGEWMGDGSAIEAAFRANVSYSQLIKPKGSKPEGEKWDSRGKCLGIIPIPITVNPDPKHIVTSYPLLRRASRSRNRVVRTRSARNRSTL